MSLRKIRRCKTKNHAQDGGMLTPRGAQHPAILPWFLVLGWRPSFRFNHGHLARFIQRAGLLLDVLVLARSLGKPFPAFWILLADTTASAVRSLRITGFDKPKKAGTRIDHAKTRAKRRAPTSPKLNDECCAFQSTPDSAPRPSASGSREASGAWRPFSASRDANGCP